jgi:hypothetical protein
MASQQGKNGLIEGGPGFGGWWTEPAHCAIKRASRADQPQAKIGLGMTAHKAEVAFGSQQ